MGLIKAMMMVAIASGLFYSCKGAANRLDAKDDTPRHYSTKTENDITYGSHPLQKMDVYFPEGYSCETPVVFLIHGGAFVAGTKKDFARPAHIVKTKGFIVVNLSHRLAAQVEPYVRELLYRVVGADPLERNNEAFKKVSPYRVISDSTNLVPTISIYPEENYVFHYAGESVMGLNNTRQFHQLLKQRNIPERLSIYKGNNNHSFNFNEQVWDKLIDETARFFFLEHGRNSEAGIIFSSPLS